MSPLELLKVNVNDHTEKKDGLTYLSWAWAWSEIKQRCPDVTYEIVKTPNGLPYFESDAGAIVYTKVTINNITHEMWLPVMDSKNKAMKNQPYKYMTRQGEKTVDAFTMFDVNKTIMRCLVKNLAMFGLGLYLYQGEDLPEGDPEVTFIIRKLEESKNVSELQTNWKTAYQALQSLPDALKLANEAKDKRKLELAA
jgi:hypothetical protein